MRKGVRASEIKAGLFGGSSIINQTKEPHKTVGYLNIQIAKEVLLQHNIRVSTSSTGGNIGRTIFFDTQKGVVQVRMHRNKNTNLPQPTNIQNLNR